MTPRTLRLALVAAVNAAFDVIENDDGVIAPPRAATSTQRRRASVRAPAAPSQAPSELDCQAARQELRRMGVKTSR